MGGLSAFRFDVWEVLLLFGIFQAIILAMVILWSSHRRYTEYYLVSLLAIMAFNLVSFLSWKAGVYSLIPHLMYISLSPLLLLGPLYFFYARSLMKQQKLAWSDGLHFALFVLGLVYVLSFYLLPFSQELRNIDPLQARAAIPITGPMVVFLSIQTLQSIYYTYRVHGLITLRPESQTFRSIAEKVSWLKVFNFCFAGFWIADFICLIWFAITGGLEAESFYFVMLLSTGFISVLTFFGMRWNKYFTEVILNRREVSYRTLPLSEDQRKDLALRISHIMEDGKLYLDPQLSLQQLATHVDVPKHHLSQVLNLSLRKSFYEFVNEYRFAEVKRRLADPDFRHLTILAIAFDSGFNNKNTFNKVFKKYAGMTPSQYLNQLAGM